MAMKTILAFVGGGERDAVVLETAAAAVPFAAHIDCFHAHVPLDQASRYANLDFAAGDGLSEAIHHLKTNSGEFSRLAGENVRAFCARAGIEMCEGAPSGAKKMTARFFEEASNNPEILISHASRCDLIVMGRLRQKQGLAPDTLEYMVRHSGRPVLVAASAAPRSLTDTIMICWKDDANTAGAITAAKPLLAAARRVLFVNVAKHEGNLAADMTAVARDLAGVSNAEVQITSASRGGVPEALATAADECDATLLVAGAYGRSRGKEILFGSCTDNLVKHCDRPILLKH